METLNDLLGALTAGRERPSNGHASTELRHVCKVLDAHQMSLRRHGNPPALQEYLVVTLIVAEPNVDSGQSEQHEWGKPQTGGHTETISLWTALTRQAGELCLGLKRG